MEMPPILLHTGQIWKCIMGYTRCNGVEDVAFLLDGKGKKSGIARLDPAVYLRTFKHERLAVRVRYEFASFLAL